MLSPDRVLDLTEMATIGAFANHGIETNNIWSSCAPGSEGECYAAALEGEQCAG